MLARRFQVTTFVYVVSELRIMEEKLLQSSWVFLRTAGGLIARSARVASSKGLQLVYPGICAACGGECDEGQLPYREVLLCRKCIDDFDLSTGPACNRCAASLPAGVLKSEQCPHCAGRRLRFQRAIAAGRYRGAFRDMILKMKRAEGNWVSLAVGRLVWERCQSSLREEIPDIVVPVPMHWRRRIVHGTNSAALLAEVLAQRLQKPLANRLLRRRRHTAPQFSLSTRQRRANVRGCFAARPGKMLAGAHVLLVDDIMTSGATCNEAARVLRQAGASRVTVVVAARAVGG
jgi:ComF family protein